MAGVHDLTSTGESETAERERRAARRWRRVATSLRMLRPRCTACSFDAARASSRSSRRRLSCSSADCLASACALAAASGLAALAFCMMAAARSIADELSGDGALVAASSSSGTAGTAAPSSAVSSRGRSSADRWRERPTTGEASPDELAVGGGFG